MGGPGCRPPTPSAPEALAQLQGHSVAVEPWEIGVAWAYELDWQPLPVFQNYTAYTPSLDRLNSAAVEDPDGPERILRDDTQVVVPEFPGPDLDGRYPGWDPPEQARAVLCNFAPLYADELWQVLGRVPDRCGRAARAGLRSAPLPGVAVKVPRAGPGRGRLRADRRGRRRRARTAADLPLPRRLAAHRRQRRRRATGWSRKRPATAC